MACPNTKNRRLRRERHRFHEDPIYWGVSVSRARAILASRKIKRVSGYPADKITAVKLRQGARTDLAKGDSAEGRPEPGDSRSRGKESDG
jgi:hypothetical protein